MDRFRLVLVVRNGETDEGTPLQGMYHVERGNQRVMEEGGRGIGPSRAVGNGLVRIYKGRKGFMLGGTQENSGGVIRPGNTSVRDLLADRRFTGFVTDFPSNTGVGRVKDGMSLSSGAP